MFILEFLNYFVIKRKMFFVLDFVCIVKKKFFIYDLVFLYNIWYRVFIII